MLAANNLLKPSDGRPVTVPTQDMVLGSYYLTLEKGWRARNGRTAKRRLTARSGRGVDGLSDEGVIGLHAHIKVRMSGEFAGRTYYQIDRHALWAG